MDDENENVISGGAWSRGVSSYGRAREATYVLVSSGSPRTVARSAADSVSSGQRTSHATTSHTHMIQINASACELWMVVSSDVGWARRTSMVRSVISWRVAWSSWPSATFWSIACINVRVMLSLMRSQSATESSVIRGWETKSIAGTSERVGGEGVWREARRDRRAPVVPFVSAFATVDRKPTTTISLDRNPTAPAYLPRLASQRDCAAMSSSPLYSPPPEIARVEREAERRLAAETKVQLEDERSKNRIWQKECQGKHAFHVMIAVRPRRTDAELASYGRVCELRSQGQGQLHLGLPLSDIISASS